MTRHRDTQRAKLYRAENHWRRAIGDAQFRDQLGYLMFVEKVERDKWFRRKYGARTFTVADGRGTRRATAWGSRHLSLPRWARTPGVILHEVAHCVTHTEHDSDVAAHGWEFASVMLDLVRHFLGVENYRKLRRCFAEGHVRYKRPREGKPLTPAQREAFERMRARRAAAKPNDAREIAIARANEA
jgi:putative metallohydrolase (TIGR04338 family)